MEKLHDLSFLKLLQKYKIDDKERIGIYRRMCKCKRRNSL